MKLFKHPLIRTVFLFVVLIAPLYGQVLQWEPAFPTMQDTIRIVYNARLGNGALAGASEIYAHTGVLTNESEDASDWDYVKTSWLQNTTDTKLTALGNDLWEIKFHIRSYYQIPENVHVTYLAFVFRTATGNLIGRDSDGGDLFIPVYETGMQLSLQQPQENPVFLSLNDTLSILAIGQQTDTLKLLINESVVFTTTDDTLFYQFIPQNPEPQAFEVIGFGGDGQKKQVTFETFVLESASVRELPDQVVPGINVTNATSATFVLFAPGKEFVYLIGDFNQWQIDNDYRLHQTPDGQYFWLTLNNLDSSQPIGFQYLVDGTLRIADPYAPLVLDPDNDLAIETSVYPNLKSYPTGKTEEIVSVFSTDEAPFEWEDQTYLRPEKKDLLIYELLIRDFVETHQYQTLIDTLNYLETLGINAIELMPINEFEGNLSWGYNPSFYFAPDKYYGTAQALKGFVNACHKRGIAVIMDMVLNHAYGQCSLVRLYADLNENPYFNATAPHTDYAWGYDFNHGSEVVQAFVDRVNAYWLTEFHVDGFRFDFTRGFTNKQGSSGAYDASRIAILKRMYDAVCQVDPKVYVILEHLVDTDREKAELANYGMLLWQNSNPAYSQSVMGWLSDSQRSSDLSSGYFKNKGFSEPHLVTYMESHDESRQVYNALQYGNSYRDYDIKNLDTALDRVKLAGVFFWTIPGPKMMWQFGELGYDQYLADSGSSRTEPKPILWNYYQQPDRFALYQTFSNLIALRKSCGIFTDPETQVAMRVGQGQFDRYIRLSNDSLNVVIMGNFDIGLIDVAPDFQHVGWWYDFFSGDSIWVENTYDPLELKAGEYHIYSDQKMGTPEYSAVGDPDIPMPLAFSLEPNYPNPFNSQTTISYCVDKAGEVSVVIFNIYGQQITQLSHKFHQPDNYQLTWNGTDRLGASVASGIYICQLAMPGRHSEQKMMLLK